MRSPDPASAAWINGVRSVAGRVVFSLDEPALLYGHGLFETLAAWEGQAIDLDQHLERMRRGAVVVGLEWPDERRMRIDISAAAKEFGSPSGWLKVLLVSAGRAIVCGGRIPSFDRLRLARAVVLPWTRNPNDPLVSVKALAWAGNRLGLDEAVRKGAHEGLWRNTYGRLAEGCWSNLFVVRKRRIFTPAIREGILPGVVRALTLRAAGELGYQAHEGRVRLPRLGTADEAFLTSSLGGICPLVALDDRPVRAGRVGPVTRALADQVARIRGLPPLCTEPLDSMPGFPDL